MTAMSKQIALEALAALEFLISDCKGGSPSSRDWREANEALATLRGRLDIVHDAWPRIQPPNDVCCVLGCQKKATRWSPHRQHDRDVLVAACEIESHGGTATADAFEEWLAGPHTGTSSLTIAQVLWKRSGLSALILGRNDYHEPPRDASDFDRCRLLLQVMPHWKDRLSEVADEHPRWAPFVGAWTELDDLFLEEEPTGSAPKLYARMKELGRA